jgi:hypothetical protein
MVIYTKWVSYNGIIGITIEGNYYEIKTGKKMFREYHNGSLYYRIVGSNKRYSYKKCNETKELKKIEIIELPF